jgi:hypothetical protein
VFAKPHRQRKMKKKPRTAGDDMPAEKGIEMFSRDVFVLFIDGSPFR